MVKKKLFFFFFSFNSQSDATFRNSTLSLRYDCALDYSLSMLNHRKKFLSCTIIRVNSPSFLLHARYDETDTRVCKRTSGARACACDIAFIRIGERSPSSLPLLSLVSLLKYHLAYVICVIKPVRNIEVGRLMCRLASCSFGIIRGSTHT